MPFGSIAETGAKPGQKVVCVSIREDGLRHRYLPGKTYTVVDWFGKPCVEGQQHGKKCGAGDEVWLIPFAGFGASWEIA